MAARQKSKNSQVISHANPVSSEFALSAIARFPTLLEAKEYLEGLGYENLSEANLASFKTRMPKELAEVQARLAPEIEGEVANSALLIARRATEAESLAMERIIEKLQKDQFADPSTVLRNLSQVKTQNIDKRLALQGRPTTITQNRSTESILKALEAKGVVERIPAGELAAGE